MHAEQAQQKELNTALMRSSQLKVRWASACRAHALPACYMLLHPQTASTTKLSRALQQHVRSLLTHGHS